MTMKIALYHPWIKSKGGAERLLFEYADRSEHDVDIITQFHGGSFEEYGTEPIVLSESDIPRGFVRKGVSAGYRILLSDLDLEEYDALIVSESGIGCLVTLRNHIDPTICYCHTPLRAAHSFYHDYLDQYGFFSRQIFRTAVHSYMLLERQAWNRFDAVICNSQTTLDTVEEAGLGRNVPKSIIYPGADVEQFRNDGKGDYFLYPSRFKKYKRQELAIEAFKEYRERTDKHHRLILAGYPDAETYLDELRGRADDDIEIRTDVSDEEMRELYAESCAVLFTASREDWGIVPVEAMASGKPVIATDEGGPTESIQDGHNGFLVPANAGMIADRMTTLTDDEDIYERMSKKAEERAQEFTWDAFTTKLDAEVEQSVQQRR